MGKFQTRNDDGEVLYFNTFGEALNHATIIDKTVWKISFSVGESRIRLVRAEDAEGKIIWYYEPIEYIRG